MQKSEVNKHISDRISDRISDQIQIQKIFVTNNKSFQQIKTNICILFQIFSTNLKHSCIQYQIFSTH